MAEINKETIQYLTRLCRIDCTEEEQEALLKDLKKILTYIEQLQEVDTSNTPACNHVLEEVSNVNANVNVNVMREDVVGKVLNRDVFLSNTLHTGGLVRIPPVIKQN